MSRRFKEIIIDSFTYIGVIIISLGLLDWMNTGRNSWKVSLIGLAVVIIFVCLDLLHVSRTKPPPRSKIYIIIGLAMGIGGILFISPGPGKAAGMLGFALFLMGFFVYERARPFEENE